MQFNPYPSQSPAGASSTAYSTASPPAPAQLAYRPTLTDQYNSYSSYPTPVNEYPPYPPYSSTPGLSAVSAASYDSAGSPTSTHPQQHHQQPPPPHYTFPSTPATTDTFPSHSLDREPSRRISLPLSSTHSPPMYSPASYSAQGHPQWHRDRSGSGSFPADLPYHHPAATAAAVAAIHGLTRYDSPLSAAAVTAATGNPRWQQSPQQQPQHHTQQHQHQQHQHQHHHHQAQYQSQPLPRSNCPPSTTTTTGTGSPEAEPQNSILPSVYNAGYPYYAQPATAPIAPPNPIRTSPLTSTPAYPSLNTDLAAPFNTGLPPLTAATAATAAVASTLSSTTSAPSASLSPAVSARSTTSSHHSAGEGEEGVSPRRRPRMRGIIPTSMRELEPNVKQEIDSWLLRYLNRLCGDAEAKDRMGHLIHQSYTSKRTQRYEQMYGWRPLKFRIEAFVNGFIDLLTAEGFPQDVIVKIPHYLNSCRLFSRFNESGNRMKSQGQTIWRVRARPRPADPSHPSTLNPGSTAATASDPANPASMVWEFLPYERSIVGMPPLAIVGSPWQWNLKVHDHWAPRKKVQWSVQGAPSWMSLSGNKLKGTPKVGENCQVHVVAKFQEEGDPQPIVVQAKFTVQVSRALGSWKKHQPSVSVVQHLSSPQHHLHQQRTSAGPSEAASPTDLQDFERIVGQQQQHQLQQHPQGSSIMPMATITETSTEDVFVYPQYLSQIPQAQAARAY